MRACSVLPHLQARGELLSRHMPGVLLGGNTTQPGLARLGAVGQGLPPAGSDVWDSHLTDDHREIHVNARML